MELFLPDHPLGKTRIFDHKRELSRATLQRKLFGRAIGGASDGSAEQQNARDFILRKQWDGQCGVPASNTFDFGNMLGLLRGSPAFPGVKIFRRERQRERK